MKQAFGIVVVLAVMSVAAVAPQKVWAQQAGGPQAVAPLSIGETFTLQSAVMTETRRINVYLPPAYRDTPATRLPVRYMPDGGIGEDFLHIAEGARGVPGGVRTGDMRSGLGNAGCPGPGRVGGEPQAAKQRSDQWNRYR